MSSATDLSLGPHGFRIWPDVVVRSAGFPFDALTDAVSDGTGTALAGAVSDEGDDKADDEAHDEAHDEGDDKGDDDGFVECDWATSMTEGLRRAVDLARSDDIRMALLWQNPQVLALSVDWLASGAADVVPRNQRRRASEHTVVKYLQRYHTKNESVGFFGPVTWARFGSRAQRIAVDPGDRVRGRQRAYFEDWAIEALARAFAADPEIAEQLPPVLGFGVVRLGQALARPDGGLVRLAAEPARIVRLIDGQLTVPDIAAEIGWPGAEVERALEPLLDEGVVIRGFEVPPDLDSERTLAAALRGLRPGAAVARALTALDDLEADRAAAQAATTPDELSAALARLDERFAVVSHASPTRRRDQAPAGRRILTMQAERCAQVELGARLVADIAAPLGLVLEGARWLARRAGEEFEVIATKLHAELAEMYHDGAVPLNALVSRIVPLTQPGHWLDELVDDLERRWTAVLDPDFAAARETRTAADLAGTVQREFGGPAPGYAAGRHQSPDVMIAASSPAAIEAGHYTAVLGELHVGMVTVDSRSLIDAADDPGIIGRNESCDRLADQPRFVPLHVRGTDAAISGWDHPAPDAFSPDYTYLSFGDRVGERAAPGRRVPAQSVLVSNTGAGLWARFPDAAQYPLLAVLGEYVVYPLVSRFRMLPARRHSPRITIDRLVVTRETWRIPCAELDALTRMAEPDAYAGLRRLAASYGLARHTFWRPARATKPIYLDLCSPLLAAVAVKEIRRAAAGSDTITFSEMYPGPGDLWLPDACGRRYTSELRLTAADTTLPAPVIAP